MKLGKIKKAVTYKKWETNHRLDMTVHHLIQVLEEADEEAACLKALDNVTIVFYYQKFRMDHEAKIVKNLDDTI